MMMNNATGYQEDDSFPQSLKEEAKALIPDWWLVKTCVEDGAGDDFAPGKEQRWYVLACKCPQKEVSVILP